MAVGSPQSITYTGVNITMNAAIAFDTMAAADRRFLWVKNGSGVSMQAQVVVPGQTFGQNNPDATTTVPAGEERMIGPIDPALVNPTTGVVDLVLNPVTSVTVAAVDLPKPPPDLP